MLWNPDQNLWFISCHVFDKQREDSMEQLLDYFPQTHQNCLLSTEKWLESSIKKEEEDKVAGWLWVSFYFSVQIPSAMWELLLVALSTLGMVCKKITHTHPHTHVHKKACRCMTWKKPTAQEAFKTQQVSGSVFVCTEAHVGVARLTEKTW